MSSVNVQDTFSHDSYPICVLSSSLGIHDHIVCAAWIVKLAFGLKTLGTLNTLWPLEALVEEQYAKSKSKANCSMILFFWHKTKKIEELSSN